MKNILFAILVGISLILLQNPWAFAGEGHDAGYSWAEQHDITDTDYSNGNSESFNEGVREYAEEQAEALRENDEQHNENIDE